MTQQVFTGGLRPNPGVLLDWPERKQALARIIIDGLAGYTSVPPVIMAADVEDFWEDACRMHAAIQACLRHTGQPPVIDWKTVLADDSNRLGTVNHGERATGHARDEFIGHELVRQYGGRPMLLGSLNGPDDVCEWLADLHRTTGAIRGVVKCAQSKTGIWLVNLSGDPQQIYDDLYRAAGDDDWTLVHHEESPERFLAQGFVDMVDECRFFIVDGRIITATSLLHYFREEDLSDQWHKQEILSAMFRPKSEAFGQDATDPVTTRWAVMRDYRQFVERILDGRKDTFVVDVAFDAATGRMVVVEINGMPNAGLFASKRARNCARTMLPERCS